MLARGLPAASRGVAGAVAGAVVQQYGTPACQSPLAQSPCRAWSDQGTAAAPCYCPLMLQAVWSQGASAGRTRPAAAAQIS